MDLAIINHPPKRLPGPSHLHLLVQRDSAGNSNVPAIDFLAEDQSRTSISYAQLHSASDSLAAEITRLASIRPQQKQQFVVPLLVPQGPNLYIALLAILKAGGAFCPLNLDVPLERAKFILEDVDARVVVTTAEYSSKLPQDDSKRAVLIVGNDVASNAPTGPVAYKKAGPDDLAYVMYTSGSTGTPKGVGVSHDAAAQSLLAHDRHIPQFERFLQFAAPTFDVSVFEIFFPLFRGNTLVSCTRPAMLNDLPGVMRQMDVDACELTPSVAGSLLRRRDNAPQLRVLLTIGEMLTRPVVQEFGGSDGRPSMLWGMYGPTEAAIHCTVHPDFASNSSVSDIGVPFDTVSAFILDLPEDESAPCEFKVLPRGEVGELAVGGPQVAQGYINRPELTARAFIDTPYGRLYRTGDKARIKPDGTLECLGRTGSGQVKLRGQRLELGEVEHAALRTEGCHSSVAAIVNNILVLFCAVDDTKGMVKSIEGSCKSWLPGFMLPGDIVVRKEFPHLPSGKIDRKALVSDYQDSRREGSVEAITFQDELEERLCALVGAALGAQISPSQNLARAGMDSLTAIKLSSALRQDGLTHNTGAVDILGARTVSALRSHILQFPTTSTHEEDAEITRGNLEATRDHHEVLAEYQELLSGSQPIDCIHPCTPLQTSMLAETIANPRAYCNWIELLFPARISEEHIRSCFNQLAQENEALRTGFLHHREEFLQVIFTKLDPSIISASDCTAKQFQIENELDFLRPFRVQISRSPTTEGTLVVVQLHHAVYDGWSWDSLMSDLAGLLGGAQVKGRPQFRDVSSYYRSTAFFESRTAAKEFWAEYLLDFQPPPLPCLNPKIENTPAISSYSLAVEISPEDLGESLRDVHCGLQTVFQASLAWLWGSMVGSEDVVVGSVTSGRTIPVCGIEDVIGPCIASVPIRTHLSQVRTLKDLVVSVQTANRSTLRYSTLPLAEIKRAAGIRAGHAIYDVLFVYQESLSSKERASNIIKEIGHQDYLETALLVEVEPRKNDFLLRMTYHNDKFPEAQIKVMTESLRALALHMSQNLAAEVASLPTVFPERLVSIYNPYPESFSGVPDLAIMVESVARAAPEKEALRFADQILENRTHVTSVTFDQLNRDANQIAWYLIHKKNVQPGDIVAIVMEKSVSLYKGILGILKAGCAYLALLPSTPVQRLQFIFQQAGVKVCLTDTAAYNTLGVHLPDCQLVSLEQHDAFSAYPTTSEYTHQPDPNRLAYVVFTSGSTGTPKGVCVTQLNMTSNLDVLSRIYPVQENSRLLQSCSQAFDVSVFEIFFAWTQGMCLCSGTNDSLFADLELSIRELGVTHLSMTPTVASLVNPANVPGVRFLVTAGEPMTETVAQKWGEKLYQGYGPSETTNICSVKKMGGSRQAIRHLGWSFDNTSTFVMSKDGGSDIVPLGCLGEFCFGGDQVAQGYLAMPNLTAQKFIDHPEFGRLYRSGDLGRMLPDGSMVIVGRSDDQIKIRGQRVELGEITAMLALLAEDCTTLLVRGGETSTDQIVSFVVPSDQNDATEFHLADVESTGRQRHIRELYQVLGSRLPTYMIPSAIVPVSMLPTTASGKLDRPRLLETFRGLSKEQVAVLSPGAELDQDSGEWTGVESQIADVVSCALGVRRQEVQRLRPLVTLGLDSISAIQVSKQLKASFGVQFPISLILQNPTVARLAGTLSELKAPASEKNTNEEPLVSQEVAEAVTEKFRRRGITFTSILPCTPLQESMLATSTGKGSYVNRMLFRVHGDLETLKQAWDVMLKRHDILRTCFATTDDAQRPIVQVVLDAWKPQWMHLDAAQSGVDTCVDRQVGLLPDGIDTFEPAVSFAAIADADEKYLSFVCHHALYDGVAIDRLLHEVELTASGQPLEPTPSYEKFLRSSLSLPALTDMFWSENLSEFEPKLARDLIIDDTKRDSFRDALVLNDIPTSELKKRASELGVSLLALVQASWASTLGCLFRTGDVCFGNVVSGRSLPVEGMNELVAPCFNTIPVRVDLDDAGSRITNLDAMKRLQKLNSDMIEYQFTPLRKIQRLAAANGGRLFDTLLLLQTDKRDLNHNLWEVVRDDGEMDIPLVCEIVPESNSDKLGITLHVQGRNTMSHEVAKLILELFSYSLNACLKFPAALNIASAEFQAPIKERLQTLTKRSRAKNQDATADDGPWTPTETAIRNVLAALSPSAVDHIGKRTTIYQLGLDSITAVHIASSLRQSGYQVLASDVIGNPTCMSLARFIESNKQEGQSSAPIKFDLIAFEVQVKPQLAAQGVGIVGIEAIVPCTPLQAGMMAQFIRSGGKDYFNHLHLRFEPDVSQDQIRQAWKAVCQAHPILRTGLISIEHPDCAFAMVQWEINRFEPRHVNSGGTPTSEMGIMANSPHLQLWDAVIIIDEKPSTDRALLMHLGIHHALYDAHSLEVIMQDFASALKGGDVQVSTGIEAPALDIISQASASSTRDEAFWKNQANKVVINGFPVMTPLRKFEREIVTRSVTSIASLSSLEQAVAKAGYTMQVIFQAAWTRILASYLGETSVVFGVVLSGRNTDTTRNAVFPCITTLPVITANTDSNRDLLEQMLQYNTELYKQQHQPLVRVQQWLGVPDARLFDTLLVYQKFEVNSPEARPWQVEADFAHVDYPVSIEVEPTVDGRLRYQVTFFDDILPKEQADVMLHQFDAVVRHLAFEPLGKEGDLFPLSQNVFSVLPPENPELPTEVQFLHQFVERQAIQTPQAVALHFVERFDGNDEPVGRKWTYSQLDANGNRVANMLAPHVKTGDIVAVYFDKCPEAYFSILGTLKAGCAFVALDPNAPASRNEFIVQDSGASALLTSRDKKAQVGFAVSVPVLGIEEDLLASVSYQPPILDRSLHPSDVSYCLYTSGTTGTPKGCEITHDNTVQCMLVFKHIFEGHWEADSRWLQFASLHFDVSVLEQYWSWSVGITLVAAPKDVILEDLSGTISRLDITHIDLTPSLARLVHPRDVPSLCRGVFITGGESLKQEILDAWGDKGVIYNFYGPTEATIGVTVYPQVPVNGRASNIGKQFINVGSFVMEPGTERPVLRGGVGELCVSGRLVGKGYLKREDLTADRFPTLSQFGERIYRTGDLVRVLHNGCFDFLGRADDQVKLRGQRLEIGEIDHAIRKGVDEVKDVATLVVRNESQQKDFLVSFVVARDGSGARGELEVVEGPEASRLCREVRDVCRSKLPGYMVPTYVIQLPFIPLSANNKAEMKQLRAFFSKINQEKLVALASSADQSSQKLSSTGRRIAKAIAEMQRIDAESITSRSSIFELGLDSISVLRLARALKKAGMAQAAPAVILGNPLLADLARALETANESSDFQLVAAARHAISACAHTCRPLVCQELKVSPDEIEYIAPCSALQEGMVSKPLDYLNTFRFRLGSGVKPSVVCSAVNQVVASFPILRTRFVITSDGVVQVALKEPSMSWEEALVDTEKSLERKIDELVAAWMSRNKKSLREPLYAALVHYGRNSEHCDLLLGIFHGLYDANSLALVLDRIAAEYHGRMSEKALPTDEEPVPSFLDALCHGPLQNFSGTKEFWIEHLRDATPIHPSITEHTRVVSRQLELSFNDLERLGANMGVTHQALVQAAWVKVLENLESHNKIVGIVVSGRSINLDGAERVVGPLFNTIPFRARISPGNGAAATSWQTLLRQCHAFNTAVLDFQHVPLRDIQKWCSKGKPLFDTLFSFQKEDSVASTQAGQLWEVVEDVRPSAAYPLALEATLSGDGNRLSLLLVAQDGVAVDGEGLSQIMTELRDALESMVRDPEGIIRAARDTTGGGRVSEDRDSGVAVSSLPSAPSTPDLECEGSEYVAILRQEIAVLAGLEGDGHDAIDPNASIFELGLDSIDVIKLAARLKERDLPLSTGQLMKAQTIQGMVAELHQFGTRSSRSVEAHTLDSSTEIAPDALLLRLGLDATNSELDVRPATALQDAMVADMIESDFHLYFNHDILELSPSVDIDQLKTAWTDVISSQDNAIYTAWFEPLDSSDFNFAYCQVEGCDPRCREQADHFWHEHHDLDEGSTEELDAICESARLRASKRGGRGDLLQVTLAKVKASSRRFLVLSIAHALYDGWSLALLHQDVLAAYHGLQRPSRRPKPREIGYELAKRSIIPSPKEDGSFNFWSGFLEGSTPTMFPLSCNPKSQGIDDVLRVEVVSSRSLSELTRFCKATGVTAQVLGQACWAALLAHLTGGSLDVTFGVVVSGRDDDELEKLAYPVMNTVAVRSVLHGTISSWARYMQNNMGNIRPFQHLGLREAQKLAGSKGPLFNTLFMQQRQPPSVYPSESASEPLWKSVGGIAKVDYPVCVEMETTDSGLIWRTACDMTLVSAEHANSLARRLDEVLGRVLEFPDEDVLAFRGSEVSICGLPSILLKSVGDSPAEISADIVMESGEDPNKVWTATELIIRDALAEVSMVPLESILQSHSIYHLGLDSVSAIKASLLLRKKGVKLGFRDMLRAKSISEMAEFVRDELADEKQQDAVPVSVSPLGHLDIPALLEKNGITAAETVLPATAMQVHMLSTWQNTNGFIFYPEFRYHLTGPADLASISRAWNQLVAENPILRTVFISTEDPTVPVLQVVLDESVLDKNPPAAAKPKYRRLLSKLKKRLSTSSAASSWTACTPKGPLTQPYCSLMVNQEGKARWALRLRIHHALYDAVSLRVIMNQFSALLSNRHQQLQPLSTVEWEKAATAGSSSATKTAAREFWTRYLDGAKTTSVQFVSDAYKSAQSKAKSWTSLVEPSAIRDVSKLQELCRAEGVSIQSLFFAAYADFLSAKKGVKDIVFGVYLANRADDEGMQMFPTLRLVPLRVRINDGGGSVWGVAKRVQEDLQAIMSGRNTMDAGLWEVKEWTGGEVVVDSFVNFLSSGVDGFAQGQEDKDDGKVKLVNKSDLDGGDRDFGEKVDYQQPEELKGAVWEEIKKAYPPAVDVEVAIGSEGEMTVGIFGPGERVDDAGARTIVDGIAGIFRRLMEA
ncbi:non-ribosomal peptide synthetase [Cladorrhinum samala]|uniref:Non-ribosomal peptide synthetase n=1 Tax=Cladorrhinum samala TaxID=585594 RepID=A0AAV9HL63_9PEZI|nr:non-ribosomal peptide synthetase [Cladorrhinum samala]